MDLWSGKFIIIIIIIIIIVIFRIETFGYFNLKVSNWLKEKKFPELVNVFEGFSGETFLSLYEMKQKDYTLFYNTITQQIADTKATVKLSSKMNFIKAFEDLFKH